MKKNKNPIFEILNFSNLEKNKLILATILSAVSVVAGFIPYISTGKLIIDLVKQQANLQSIIFLAAISGTALVLEKIFNGIATYISHKATYCILYNTRCEIVDKLNSTSMGYITDRESGSFKQTIIDLVDRLETALAHMIPELLPNLILPVVVIVYLFIHDWQIALAALVSIIIGFITWGLMMGKNAMNIFRLTQEGNEQMNSGIVEYVNGMEVIKAFHQTVSSMERYEKVVTNYRDVLTRWFNHCWPYLSVYSVVTPATIAFVLPIGGFLLYNGNISFETFIVCLVLSLGIVPPLMKAVTFTDHINEIFAANTKIQEILQAPELIQVEKKVYLKDNSIAFENVSFSYNDIEILHNITFSVPAHTSIAIVGASGSGKSTITKLIARFWDVSQDSIKIGGIDLKQIPFEQLMDNISYVTQDSFLPDTTIRENIVMGKPNATETEIIETAKKACCDEFISRFPDGYNTKVGETGGRLSGGERQRIAIARAIIKNAPIIILDEATAAIDPENDYKIQLALTELTKGKSLIIVAHRLSTIINSNQIIVLEKGKIIASGTHNELLKDCPTYQSLWKNHIGATSWSIKNQFNNI